MFMEFDESSEFRTTPNCSRSELLVVNDCRKNHSFGKNLTEKKKKNINKQRV